MLRLYYFPKKKEKKKPEDHPGWYLKFTTFSDKLVIRFSCQNVMLKHILIDLVITMYWYVFKMLRRN